MDMLKVIASGRLGQDPRIRQLDDGTPILNLSMASGRRKKGEDVVYWWDVTMFGQRGLTLHDMLKKGSHVLVEGDYGERTYTAKDGTQKTQREIVASNIYLLDKKDGSVRHEGGFANGEPDRTRPRPSFQNQNRAQHRDQLSPPSYGQKRDETPAFPDFGGDDDIPF
jgi:single stranded DNA-binding protein